MKYNCNFAILARRWSYSAALALTILAFMTLSAFADDGKLSRELKGSKGSQTVDVIVQYRVAPGAQHKSRAQGHAGRVNSEIPLIKGLQVSLPANRAAALSNDPDVVFV